MKRVIVIFIYFLGISSIVSAQTLPSPVFTSIPCYGAVGITDSIHIMLVPGATSYIWETNAGQINSLLLDGSISPVSANGASQAMSITYVTPQLFWEVCVTAVSACCTSAASCVLIPSMMMLQFSSANSPVAVPNSTGIYTVEFLCNPQLSSATIYWFVTGDITFNNGTQNTTTGQGVLDVPLNFGTNFTSGTLCAYTVSSFGMPSDTICMTINAPVGISESITPGLNFYYDNQGDQVVIDLPKNSGKNLINIFDSSGRLVSKIIADPAAYFFPLRIDVSEYSEGMYIIYLMGNTELMSGKFLLQR